MVTISNIKTFITAPGRCDLVVVKIETSDPTIYGLGCATFTQRALAIKTAVDEYLAPLLYGRCVNNIEDLWQSMYGNSYWRNGPVLNNAISGIDEALWDIKGKMLGAPLYELFGGKCRKGAQVYLSGNAYGSDTESVVRCVKERLDAGCRYIRVGGPKVSEASAEETQRQMPDGAIYGGSIDPDEFISGCIEQFKTLREQFGYGPKLMLDVHEKLTPPQMLKLAKGLEPYDLFFLEDCFSPEKLEWLNLLRMHTTTPLSIGELFNNENEYRYVITNRLTDYIRCHISQLGGITPARKVAVLAEQFGIKTIWHGPGDLSPVGVAAQLHIDLAIPNFGLQEYTVPTKAINDVFPGSPELRGDYLYVNEAPGLGVDFDEGEAEKYPPIGYGLTRFINRLPDGTVIRS